MIPEDLLHILACPKCKGELLFFESFFVCESCKLKFEVKEDIPDFLLDDAKEISEDEIKKLKDEG
ncbi:hypothetical protein SAMN06265182_0388 [Persephonella hydrogeniphila]|uniref:Uncharacterized protein n=1 Tax=Persephonella hydrogeniphila TaxID=198703 RepID=A0A285N202_9AQUI|nr:Trm112 family protein [Persephonella hydrogeniphila]SNZ03469.1 hypothetical protein SAMN06265182_0388 [Persephonella hydrogeniphila]